MQKQKQKLNRRRKIIRRKAIRSEHKPLRKGETRANAIANIFRILCIKINHHSHSQIICWCKIALESKHLSVLRIIIQVVPLQVCMQKESSYKLWGRISFQYDCTHIRVLHMGMQTICNKFIYHQIVSCSVRVCVYACVQNALNPSSFKSDYHMMNLQIRW